MVLLVVGTSAEIISVELVEAAAGESESAGGASPVRQAFDALQPADRDVVFSLHEPQAYCLSKGKEHKKYEFGSKASVVMTKTAGGIVGAVAHAEDLYDGDALSPALEQTVAITGQTPSQAIVDRGYRGRKTVNGTEVLVPGKTSQSKYFRAKMRARFRRRTAIEPLIGHLKDQYRRARCFLKGFVGDQVNLLLAAAA